MTKKPSVDEVRLRRYLDIADRLRKIALRLDSVESQLARLTSLLVGAESSPPKAPPPNSKNSDATRYSVCPAEVDEFVARAVRYHLARSLVSLSEALTASPKGKKRA